MMNKKYFWLVIAIVWVCIGLALYFGPSNSTESTPSTGPREAADEGSGAGISGDVEGVPQDASAQSQRGFCYYVGEGVPVDYPKAAEWYRKAAEQGHVIAQNFLGYMYDNGLGVPQDEAQAVKWYRKAESE
jgi:TPR repeat protein